MWLVFLWTKLSCSTALLRAAKLQMQKGRLWFSPKRPVAKRMLYACTALGDLLLFVADHYPQTTEVSAPPAVRARGA